jgi:hypothetical protein
MRFTDQPLRRRWCEGGGGVAFVTRLSLRETTRFGQRRVFFLTPDFTFGKGVLPCINLLRERGIRSPARRVNWRMG